MTLDKVAREGLVLLGCGKMGTALLTGWLAAGVPAASVWVIEPNPTDWLRGLGVHLNEGVPKAPAVALLAVKPQMMGAALPALQALGNGRTLFVSIAAGTSIATFARPSGAADADRADHAEHAGDGRARHHRDLRQCLCGRRGAGAGPGPDVGGGRGGRAGGRASDRCGDRRFRARGRPMCFI